MTEFVIHPPQDIHPGSLCVEYQGDTVYRVELVTQRLPRREPETAMEHALLKQFEDYFQHADSPFRLRLDPLGSDFQRRVWQALQAIPAGEVMQYGELARKLGSSARAVGNACRNNPIAIIVPCHRVVAKAGIGGYSGETAGEQIEQKRRLLRHEGVRA